MSLNNFISSIVVAQKNKKQTIKVRFTKEHFKLIELLYDKAIIRGWQFTSDKKFISVFLKYTEQGKPLIEYFIQVSTLRKVTRINKTKLSNLMRIGKQKQMFYLLNTDKGYVLTPLRNPVKFGGILIAKLILNKPC